MIRRDAGSHFLLITQHDHALLAGQFARRIGNACFAVPSPYEPVIEAIAHHDAGWPLHDDHPTLNAQGLPLHVFESSVGLATQVWSASVARAMNLGDYQGLLVSLHVFGLSAIFMEHAKTLSRPDAFEMNKFQHRQIETQEELRSRLGLSNEVPRQLGLAKAGTSHADDQLLYNFRLLTSLDRISLSLCCGKLLFPSINDLPAAPGNKITPVVLQMPEPARMEIIPWLFDQPNMTFEIPARRITKEPFKSLEEFQRLYQSTAPEKLTLTLCPAG